MSKTKYVTNGISMLPQDWEMVDKIAEENGQSRSAVMRTITRQHPLAQRLILLGQAYLLGVITAPEALDRLVDVVSDMPLPIVITAAGEAAVTE